MEYIQKNKHVCLCISNVNPKFVLIVLLEDTKLSKDYIYEYRDGKGSFKGTPFNTAGWTSVEITGKMIDKIGPILATKY